MQAEERLNGSIYSSDTHTQWIDREYYEAEISASLSTHGDTMGSF